MKNTDGSDVLVKTAKLHVTYTTTKNDQWSGIGTPFTTAKDDTILIQ